MKTDLIETKLIESGVKKRQSFRVSADNVRLIIQMAANQYSNPELAVIRELSCNAYDAMKEAGREDQSFLLHVPSELEPWFEIRDYGDGMSPEFMMDGYASVGESTKSQSNESIGGFGIGRLSFLGWAEQAIVTSFYQGVKYVYNVGYSSAGELDVKLILDIKSDEPSGVSIKFSPRDNERIDSFVQACREFFYTVQSPDPNFVGDGFIIEKPAYQIKTDTYGVRDNSYASASYTSGLNAIMGNVKYPIAIPTLKMDKRFDDFEMLFHSKIDMFFEIGDVMPLPTRENINMSDGKTISALIKRLQHIKEDMFDKNIKDLRECKTLLDAYMYISNLDENVSREYSAFVKARFGKWKGMEISLSSFEINSPVIKVKHPSYDDKNHKFYKKEVNKTLLDFYYSVEKVYGPENRYVWKRNPIQKINTGYGQVKEYYAKKVFVYDDVNRLSRNIIDFNRDRLGLTNRNRVYMVKGDASAWPAFKEELILKGIPEKNILLVSELEPLPKKSREKKEKDLNISLTVIKAGNQSGSYWGDLRGLCNHTHIDDINPGTYYIKTNNYDLPDKETNLIADKYELYTKTGLLKKVDIVVVNASYTKFIKDDWVDLSEYLGKVKEKDLKKNFTQCKLKTVKTARSDKFVEFLDEFDARIDDLIPLKRNMIKGLNQYKSSYRREESLVYKFLKRNKKAFAALHDMWFISDERSSRKSSSNYRKMDLSFSEMEKLHDYDFRELYERAKGIPSDNTEVLKKALDTTLVRVLNCVSHKTDYKKLIKEMKEVS